MLTFKNFPKPKPFMKSKTQKYISSQQSKQMLVVLASLWVQKLPRTLLLSRPMYTCVTRPRLALSPGLLPNGPEGQLWKIWGAPASPGDILVKVVGCTEGRQALPELRPFNQQLGIPLHKSHLLEMYVQSRMCDPWGWLLVHRADL